METKTFIVEIKDNVIVSKQEIRPKSLGISPDKIFFVLKLENNNFSLGQIDKEEMLKKGREFAILKTMSL